MARDRFQFLKSFADSLRELAKADEWLAKDVAWEIINYWIYWEEMNSENSIVNAIFLQMKLVIDKGHAISDANSINWKKGWRPIKDWENSQKANWNPNESETKAKKSKKENIKYKNKNIKENNNIENNIILKNDTDTKVSVYWNPDINKCIELISSYNGWIIDWTKQNWRRYSKLLIDKLNKLESIQKWEFTWYDTLEIILRVISQNKYYASKITSPENIYRNLSVLMQQCKAGIWKATASSIILPTV